MIYVKLNPKKNTSSFFDPTQTSVASQSLSNHNQVIMVDKTDLVDRFLTSKGLLEADKKEYDAYQQSEKERVEKELQDRNQSPTGKPDASQKALKEAHNKLQNDHEDLLKIHEDLTTENALLKEANAKLMSGDAKTDKTKDSDTKK